MSLPTKNRAANFSLIALSLFYLVMLGGGNYEQLNVTHTVASAPPKSLAMLQGPYGFNPVKFWAIFRPLTILLFIAALVFNWRVSTRRRKLLIVAFVIDWAVTLATFLYFAPETGIMVAAKYDSSAVDPILTGRLQLWESLNWLRLGGFYAASILLLMALNTSIVTENK